MKIYQKAVGWISFIILVFSANPAKADPCSQTKQIFSHARNLYYSGQYLLSSVHFSILSTMTCDIQLSLQAKFNYALSMSELDEMSEVTRTLQELENQGDLLFKRKSRLLLAFLHPQLVADLDSSDRLKIELWNLRDTQPYFRVSHFNTLGFKDQAELTRLQFELFNSSQKKPWLAASASTILPGAGQAYVGSLQSAAVAFILNSLFLAATIELAKKDMPISATAAGLVFSVTYIGNIINAADAAKKYNQSSRREPEKALKKALFPEFSP